ncbi:MAG: hypothetical protein GX094_07785 [Clostridiales bacterium]|nr:hypothetical protein [Clostridiales bacterium]
MKKKYGAIVSHTHWDREWYQPFQGFRKRLVYMVDHLIQTMESTKDFKFFFFDGQTIVLEDYLEIRPENRDRLAALIKEGRIEIGPWYVMPDEFLVSGEAIIRNLLKGFRVARAFGVEPCKCGYVCDMFGHNSQLPQILNGFGIDTAVFYRGVKDNSIPAEVYWEASNGSRVLGIKLDAQRSYSDFYFAIRWPFDGRDYDVEELIERMKKHLAYKQGLQSTDVYLFMDGVDHIEIEPRLPWMIELFNETFDDFEFHHETLTGFFNRLKAETGEFPVLKGELLEPGYIGINNQVLSNVWSSRVDIKKQNDRCQELLTKWAEPLSVFAVLKGRDYPYGFLRRSWEYLLKNHAHDSICGCSIGQVHRDMHYWFDQSRLVAEEMIGDAMKYFAQNIDTSDFRGDRTVTVFNNSEIDEEKVYIFELAFDSHENPQNILLYDEKGQVIPYQILETYPDRRGVHEFGQLIKFIDRKIIRIAAKISIPSMGYRTLSYEMKNNPPLEAGEYTYKYYVQPIRYLGTMATGYNTFENEYLKVQIEGNGTLTVTNKETGKTFKNLLLIEDRGEVGDGWNYRKPLMDSIYSSYGTNADISVDCDGINAVKIRIMFNMNLPKGMEASSQRRSDGLDRMGVTHEILLARGSKQLTVKTIIDNRVKDHIVKLLFPTELKTDYYYTDTPFDLIKRSFIRPDRSDYTEIDTRVSPSQGFMMVHDSQDGLAVFTKGLYEYEAYDNPQRTLALTLMRCFSNEVGTFGGTDGQLQGKNEFEYALRFFTVGEERRLYKEYQQFKAGIKWTWGRRQKGNLPPQDSFVRLSYSRVVISCIKRAEDYENAYVIRLFNLGDESVEDKLVFNQPVKKCALADLNENFIKDYPCQDSEVPFTISKKEILTFMVNF